MNSNPHYYDRVLETSTTTGTGTYTLAGAVTGYQGFSVVGNANTCYYCATAVDANGRPSGDWEVGVGTYTASGTLLARTAILSSSNANAAVNWAVGTRRLFLTQPSNALVRSATRILTDDEIKALPTTPIALAAAPGANLRLVFTQADLVMDARAGAYTNLADPSRIHIRTEGSNAHGSNSIANDTGATPPLAHLTALLTNVSSRVQVALVPFSDVRLPGTGVVANWGNVARPVVLDSAAVNSALTIRMLNSLGNLTGGHSTNTLAITMFYRIVSS